MGLFGFGKVKPKHNPKLKICYNCSNYRMCDPDPASDSTCRLTDRMPDKVRFSKKVAETHTCDKFQ